MKHLNIIFYLLAMSNFLFCQEHTQVNVAVLDLKNLGVDLHFSLILSERLRSELFKYEKFRVMSRESMKEIMDEQTLQMSGVCDDNSCYVQIGNVLGVQKIVTGSIGKLGSTYSVTVKSIDIETGELEETYTDSKKCLEDDLFIMIENAAVKLAGGKSEKLASPGEIKEIKEIQPLKSSPTGYSMSTNDDIKEWEKLGLTREEYIEYKRNNIDLSRANEYKKSIISPVGNSIKSFFFPCWGQFTLKNKRAYLYLISDVLVPIVMINGNMEGQSSSATEFGFNFGITLAILNRIVSSIDTGFSTNRHNDIIEQKYKLTLSPAYNPQNNGVVIGLAVNF